MWNHIRPSVRPSVRDLESAPKHFVWCSRISVPELSQKVVDQIEYRVNRLGNSHVVLNGVQYKHIHTSSAYFWPISFRLGIINLRVIQLKVDKFRRDRFTEGCTLLMSMTVP